MASAPLHNVRLPRKATSHPPRVYMGEPVKSKRGLPAAVPFSYSTAMQVELSEAPFGTLPGGAAATLFKLQSNALRVCITDYGARMVSIEAPDRDGRFGHVLLGFDDVVAYDAAGGSFGAVLGRYANRIAGGRFTLDGQAHQLAVNDGGNTLHGGPCGFARSMWRVERALSGAAAELALVLVSPDGDQGFPGALTARVRYRLAGDTLTLELTATADRATIVNLSAHPYFNLAGVEAHDVLDHEITIAAARFLPTDATQVPTGEMALVEGTVFDFRQPTRLGARIRVADPQLLIGHGYDHCFVLDAAAGEPSFAARAHDPLSGRSVELTTDEPGLQLYSGNALTGATVGRGGVVFRQSAGFAFEAQNFPDAINQPGFPLPILRPGELYRRLISYRFTAR